MLFNSYYFLLYFLPIVLLLYYCAHRFGLHKTALVVLSLSSFVFYAYDNVYYLALLAGSILINWCVAYIMNTRIKANAPDSSSPEDTAASGRPPKDRVQKFILLIGILIDIGVIFFFKYYDFFIENMNSLFKADFNLRHIVLPLGISFFTFQQISYLVDTYKGETVGYSFIEYVAFVSFSRS